MKSGLIHCPNEYRTEGYAIRSAVHFCTPVRNGVWSMRPRNGARWGVIASVLAVLLAAWLSR